MKKILTPLGWSLVAGFLFGCANPDAWRVTSPPLMSPRLASLQQKVVKTPPGAKRSGPGIRVFGASQANLRTMQAYWDPYQIPPDGSNAVITIYKATSLGSVFTPYKPTAVCPATRTNINFPCLVGLYHFYATATVQPYGESDPSNVSTNNVK